MMCVGSIVRHIVWERESRNSMVRKREKKKSKIAWITLIKFIYFFVCFSFLFLIDRTLQVMSVMGLKPWRNTFAWYITSFIELSIIIICISMILLAGKILPRSNPVLVLILLFDYVFSIVTFW